MGREEGGRVSSYQKKPTMGGEWIFSRISPNFKINSVYHFSDFIHVHFRQVKLPVWLKIIIEKCFETTEIHVWTFYHPCMLSLSAYCTMYLSWTMRQHFFWSPSIEIITYRTCIQYVNWILFCFIYRKVKLLIFKGLLNQKKGSMKLGGQGKDFKHCSNSWRII